MGDVGEAPRTATVPRRRLVELLARRFEARLTLVIAGGGSGKTTAMAQAMAAESDHLDVWYPCSRGDRDADELLAGLALATHRVAGGVDPTAVGSPPPLDTIHDTILAASPRRVCLVVDDVHVLDDVSALDALLEHLPGNGHLLVAGRRRPDVESARLDVAGQLVEIGQDDLLLSATEVREFANLRGVDVEHLETAGGWPAFVELAASGIAVRSRRYLEHEALAGLSNERREALARFAGVGGGDDAVARAVTGWSLEELVADLPLVRWAGDVARLHDLWHELLTATLGDQARREAILAATDVLRASEHFDRAIELGAEIGVWDDVERSITAAIRVGGDGGLRTDQLVRWRTLLPSELGDTGTAVLIDALLERERDPTSEAAEQLFDRAARRFDDDGDDEFQLVALAQLGYVARISGDLERIEAVMERIRTLAERFPPAAPFLRFGEAWTALNTARPDLQLAAMERIADLDLPTTWQVTRDHLIAHALFNLGRPHEALEHVPSDIASIPVPIPGALVTESQCHWYAGDPVAALGIRAVGLTARYGARDRYIAGMWVAAMQAYTGRPDDARTTLSVARSHFGEAPPAIVVAQCAAAEAVISIAERRDDAAAISMAGLFDAAPLGGGVSEQFMRNHLAVPFVLLGDTRRFWRSADLGPAQRVSLELAEAFVAARENDDLGAISRLVWPEPGLIAAHLPVPWAIEFALHGIRADRHEARQLANWLCERWGAPARSALRSFADDPRLGGPATELLAKTPTPPPQKVELQLLGDTELVVDGYATANPDWRRERVRALLAWLALSPATTREQLAGALWIDLPPERAAKNLRTTLSYLHDVLEPSRSSGDATWYVRVEGHRVRLHESLDVDLWRFATLLDEADAFERAGHPLDALPCFIDAVALWRGDVAADLDHEWLELERINARSRFVRASCRAAELLVATDSPGDAIEIVTRGLVADPYHERSYRALAGAYAAIGDLTSERAVLRRAAEQLGEIDAALRP